MPVEVELFDDLEAVARDAAGALDHERQASPYDSIDWLRLTRDHVLSDARLLAARARGESGTLWLFLRDEGGRRAEAYASWYTLAFAPVFAGERDPALAASLARALARRFDRITLAPMRDGEPLRSEFVANGWTARLTESSANWIAHVEGQSFEDYWRRRPSRLRNTARRKAREATLETRLYNGFDADAWTHYEQVYAASWKPVEGAPAFLRAFARQADALRLGIALHEGSPVAAQMWTVDGDVATIHKLAHAETAKALSPGTILGEAMFRHVIEHDRPRLIDFGTGDDSYKADWMDEKRPLYRLDLFNRHTLGGRLAAMRAAASALVRRLRSG